MDRGGGGARGASPRPAGVGFAIGFEASNQYFYVPLDLAEKAINCQWIADSLAGSIETVTPAESHGVTGPRSNDPQ
jgi:hypothetical protein